VRIRVYGDTFPWIRGAASAKSGPQARVIGRRGAVLAGGREGNDGPRRLGHVHHPVGPAIGRANRGGFRAAL
jgi:hypothetical protein